MITTPLSLRPVVVAIVLILASGSAVFGEELDPASVVSSLRAAQEKLARIEVESGSWSCELKATSGQSTGGLTYTIKRREDSILVLTKHGVMCKNGNEMFLAEPTKSAGGWALLKYQRVDVENAWTRLHDKRHLALYPLQAQREEFTTLNMLHDSEFKPVSARSRGNDLVDLDYAYTIPTREGGKRTPIKGTLTLARDLDWLVVKSVSRADDTPMGFPVESVLVRRAQRAGNRIVVQSICLEFIDARSNTPFNSSKYQFNSESPRSISPDEFTLTHYGLTAPKEDVYEDRGFNWLLWGGIGVACIALSVFLGWFVRRKRRAS